MQMDKVLSMRYTCSLPPLVVVGKIDLTRMSMYVPQNNAVSRAAETLLNSFNNIGEKGYANPCESSGPSSVWK
jgi:hypothetical protein